MKSSQNRRIDNILESNKSGQTENQGFNSQSNKQFFAKDQQQYQLLENSCSPTRQNHRDVYFLMEKFKESNKGETTTDICRLFSFWQVNYQQKRQGSTDLGFSGNGSGIGGPLGGQSIGVRSGYLSNNANTIKGSIAVIQDDKTSSFINYNSKSFNNKTYYNHDQRTTPNQNQTQDEHNNTNTSNHQHYFNGPQKHQRNRIGIIPSEEPSPIPQSRTNTANNLNIQDAADNYGSTNYQMDIIDNQFEQTTNSRTCNDHQFQQNRNQQFQYSELKGSISSPNTNINTIGSMEADFNPKNINLKNQRFLHNHHCIQSNEKKPRVQIPKIQMNSLHGIIDLNEKRAGHISNIQVQMSQISQISQVSGAGANQFGNTSNTPGSASNATGFVFAREASNSLQKNIRQNSDGRQPQVDSILFTQKIKLDREKNINEIQLGNVKNQVLGGVNPAIHQNHTAQNYQSSQGQALINGYNNQSNLQGGSNGFIAGREIDRNQLSQEIMNITPIMEEKEFYHNSNTNFQNGVQTDLNEFKIYDYPDQEDSQSNKFQNNKTKSRQIFENIGKQQINEQSSQCEQDNDNQQDHQNQFSFDKELNYFNSVTEGDQHLNKQTGFMSELKDKSGVNQQNNQIEKLQNVINQNDKDGEDLSELIDIDENILVKDLEQIDNRFSIYHITSSPHQTSLSSKPNNNNNPNLPSKINPNYHSIHFATNSQDKFTFNLFKQCPYFDQSIQTNQSKLQSRDRQRFQNNKFVIKRDYKFYYQVIKQIQYYSQNLNQVQLIRLTQNIPNVFYFQYLDLKTSFMMNKLGNELANINELSPILGYQSLEKQVKHNKFGLSHLRLIMSQSLMGLCRQHLTVLMLVKGIKSKINLRVYNNWLDSLIHLYRNDKTQQYFCCYETELQTNIREYLQTALRNYYQLQVQSKSGQQVNYTAQNITLDQYSLKNQQILSKNSGKKVINDVSDSKQVGVFDHLSSIESEGHEAQFEGDADEGDVLEVLQKTVSNANNLNTKIHTQNKLTQPTPSEKTNKNTLILKNQQFNNDDSQFKERESLMNTRTFQKTVQNQSKNDQNANTVWVDQRGKRKKNRRTKNANKDTNLKQNNPLLISSKPDYQKSNQVENMKNINNEILKTPDQKQQTISGNSIRNVSLCNKLTGLNTTPNDKQKDCKKKSKTRRGNHKSKSNNKHKIRHESSKSKSKSRFSNNLGFAQLQNAIENEDIDALENTQAMEKLLQAINDEQDQLDQFICHEEENYSKKFNYKVNEAERILQNSKRDGSLNNRHTHIQSRTPNYNNLANIPTREQSKAHKFGSAIIENLHQNQHHNSISNNSGSFYFPLNKKQASRDGVGQNYHVGSKKGTVKSNNISLQYNHPYNPRGAHSGSIYGLSAKKDRSSVGVPNRCFDASSSNSSSSNSSSSRNNVGSCGFKSQNMKSVSDIDQKVPTSQIKNLQFKNVENNQNYSQNSQLLTDRPIIDKKLDLGKIKHSLRHGGRHNIGVHGLGIQHDKSNERQISMVSGHSKYSNGNQGVGPIASLFNQNNSSYTNRQRFPFNNNLINRSSAAIGNYHQHNNSNHNNPQFSSLTRIGIQKISSGISGGACSNHSPSNTHQNKIKFNKIGGVAQNCEGQFQLNLVNSRKSGLGQQTEIDNGQQIINQKGQGVTSQEVGMQNNIMLLEQTTALNNKHNISSYSTNLNNQFQSTQNSFRTNTNNPTALVTSNQQNPILLKLKTTQMSRGQQCPQGNTHNISAHANIGYQQINAVTAGATINPVLGNSMMLQITSDYPLSHRAVPHHNQSSIHSSITPKSFAGARGSRLLGPTDKIQTTDIHDEVSQDNILQGISPKKQMTNTLQKNSMQPILGQINLESSQTIGLNIFDKASKFRASLQNNNNQQLLQQSSQLNHQIQSNQAIELNQSDTEAQKQKRIVDDQLQTQDHYYDKQIFIKQNTDHQFDEFKVSNQNYTDNQLNSNIPESKMFLDKNKCSKNYQDAVFTQIDKTCKAGENIDQNCIDHNNDTLTNDSKEKQKKSVLSIKMRATTSFQGANVSSSGFLGINGAQSSRLPGSHGLTCTNSTENNDTRNIKNVNQQTSQVKLRVKSLKKGDNTLISTSNLNSSVSKTSAEKIRTSSNSSLGNNTGRMLKLKFKPRNFNQKNTETENKKSDNQLDQISNSNLEEGENGTVNKSSIQMHSNNKDQNKVLTSRSGLKMQEKRRDRLARGQKNQHDQNESIFTEIKQSPHNQLIHQPQLPQQQTINSKFLASNNQINPHNQNNQMHKLQDNNNYQQSHSQRISSGPQSRLKQPSNNNQKGNGNRVTHAHTNQRQGLNQVNNNNKDTGYASKFRGRERDVKIDIIASPISKKKFEKNEGYVQKNKQTYTEQQSNNTSLEKQQSQQHKTLVQHHYYAAASMASQNNISGQVSSRSNQKLNIGPNSRRTAYTQQFMELGESVSPKLLNRLHVSQQECDNSLQNTGAQNHNLTSVTIQKQTSTERIKLSSVGMVNQSQSNKQQAIQINQSANHNQNEIPIKFQTTSNIVPQRTVQSGKHLHENLNQNNQGLKNDCDRLIELLIGEFKRKKGRNIRADVPPALQLQTLVTFWQESLSKQRILTKLLVKQQTFSAQLNNQMDTMRTATSLPSKLSDKEKWLLNFLEGTDTQQLLTLGKESTTRNYGELAMIDECLLANEICRFLKLDRNSQQFMLSNQYTDSKRE